MPDLQDGNGVNDVIEEQIIQVRFHDLDATDLPSSPQFPAGLKITDKIRELFRQGGRMSLFDR